MNNVDLLVGELIALHMQQQQQQQHWHTWKQNKYERLPGKEYLYLTRQFHFRFMLATFQIPVWRVYLFSFTQSRQYINNDELGERCTDFSSVTPDWKALRCFPRKEDVKWYTYFFILNRTYRYKYYYLFGKIVSCIVYHELWNTS